MSEATTDSSTQEQLAELRRDVAALQELVSEFRKEVCSGVLSQARLGDDWLVTLLQCAAMVQRSKRTLEKYGSHPYTPLPKPVIRGESGRANEYQWSDMKPWLEQVFGRDLPDNPPSFYRR